MTAIYALTILLCIYAVSVLIAQKTKAVFSTVLGMAILLLIGFWSGLLPATIMADAGVDKIGNTVAGILVVSLGTTINFPELKRQWKVVVTALACVIGAVAAIVLIGGRIVSPDMMIAGAPIFAGGSAATLIMTSALTEKGLDAAVTFCVSLYVTQKFIGIPLASLLLRREAKQLISNPDAVRTYVQDTQEQSGAVARRLPLALPASFARPSVYLAKLGLVAVVANFAAKLTGGRVHYFVMCLICGAVFFALGFLENNILGKTQANSLITFFVTVIIFANLATTTPQEIGGVLPYLLLAAVLGVLGTLLVGAVCSRVLKIGFGLAVSLGISCTFGFPTTMLMPQEVAEAIGRTPDEKIAIERHLLPKMLTAGFVTVTIASVLLAGAAVGWL